MSVDCRSVRSYDASQGPGEVLQLYVVNVQVEVGRTLDDFRVRAQGKCAAVLPGDAVEVQDAREFSASCAKRTEGASAISGPLFCCDAILAIVTSFTLNATLSTCDVLYARRRALALLIVHPRLPVKKKHRTRGVVPSSSNGTAALGTAVPLTAGDLKLRHQDTARLGLVGGRLLLGAVLYFILRNITKIQTDIPYQLVLLPALFPWTWFQTSALMATPVIASNGNLIKKVHFPRYVLPFSTVANNMVHFLLTIPIIRSSSLHLAGPELHLADWHPAHFLELALMGTVLILSSSTSTSATWAPDRRLPEPGLHMTPSSTRPVCG
jgi:hypothetical protein